MRTLVMDSAGVVRDDGGGAWAATAASTVVQGPGGTMPVPGAGRLIVRAGFLEDEDAPGEPDPRTWAPKGWDALEAGLHAWLEGSDGARIVVRPAFTDVLSDAPSCLRFLQRMCGERVGLLLDPIGMLAPSMLATAADHVERMLEHVGGHESVDGVVLGGSGAIGVELMADLCARLVPASTPVVVVDPTHVDALRRR